MDFLLSSEMFFGSTMGTFRVLLIYASTYQVTSLDLSSVICILAKGHRFPILPPYLKVSSPIADGLCKWVIKYTKQCTFDSAGTKILVQCRSPSIQYKSNINYMFQFSIKPLAPVCPCPHQHSSGRKYFTYYPPVEKF